MRSNPITLGGIEFSSMGKAARHFKVEPHTLRARLRVGRDPLYNRDTTAAKLAKQHGLSRSLMTSRLKKGLDTEQVLKPPSKRYPSGEWATLVARASLIGLSDNGLRARLKRGMSLANALRYKVLRRKSYTNGVD